MAIKFSDFGRARLTASIAAATAAPFTMSVDTGSRFSTYGASDFEYLVLKDASGNREAIKVTGRTGNSFTVAARALMGTTARDWAIGDLVEACLLSETMNSFMHLDGSKSMTGSLDFSGTGRRITGDLTNPTRANRLHVQSSTVNGVTVLGVLPNGTATTSAFVANNSSDPDNSSRAVVEVTNTRAAIISNAAGTGTALPLVVNVGSTDVLTIATTARTQVNHLGSYMSVANGTTGYGALQLGNSITSSNNWHLVSEGNGIATFYQGTFGSGTARLSIGSVGTTLHRADNTLEGGQINWTRASDDAVVWSADCFGSGSSPSWRLFNTSERINVAFDGTTTVYGDGFFNTNKAGSSYLQQANSNASGGAALKAICNSPTTTNNNVAWFEAATPKPNSWHAISLFNGGGSAPYLQWSAGSAVTGGLFIDMAHHTFRDQAGNWIFRIEPGAARLYTADAGWAAGPEFSIERLSASPADSDRLGYVAYKGRNSSAATVEYARQVAAILSPTAGAHQGVLHTQLPFAGTLQDVHSLSYAPTVGLDSRLIVPGDTYLYTNIYSGLCTIATPGDLQIKAYAVMLRNSIDDLVISWNALSDQAVVESNRGFSFPNLNTYANNAAAAADGVPVMSMYMTPSGALMVRI